MIPTLGQASSNVKSILQIDTNLNNAVFDKTGIHIEGWKLADISNTKLKVYIDGKKVNTFEIGNALLGFDVTEGEHNIELKYEIPCFKIGCVISISSLGCVVIYYLLKKKKLIGD